MTQFNEPEMIIIRTIERYPVNQLRDGVLACINEDLFFGYDNGCFLCVEISCDKTNDPESFEIKYRFDYKAEGWQTIPKSYREKDLLHDIDPLKGSKVSVEIIYKQ